MSASVAGLPYAMHRTPVLGSGDIGGQPRVHGLDEQLEVFDGRLGQHAMTEVEDVAGPAARPSQHVIRPRSDQVGRSEQHGGIEVALDAMLVSDPIPALVKRDTPVQRDDVWGPGL